MPPIVPPKLATYGETLGRNERRLRAESTRIRAFCRRAGGSGDIRKWCPEEETSWTPKQLISDANWQQEITRGSNSTNTSFGKGRTSPNRHVCAYHSGLVVAVGRSKAVIVIVAKQLLFLETLLQAVGRERSLAQTQPALGQPRNSATRPVLPDISSLRKFVTSLLSRSSEAISSRTSSSALPRRSAIWTLRRESSR